MATAPSRCLRKGGGPSFRGTAWKASSLPLRQGLGADRQPVHDEGNVRNARRLPEGLRQRASAGWVAAVLEVAAIVEIDRGRPARVRLRVQ
jgi:hypothetical protein